MSSISQTAASGALLVGRALELELILAALDDVLNTHRGRLVMLTGEPGVGKTRLAREALARAAALDITGSLGRCFEEHSAVAFFAFSEAVGAALAASPPKLQKELRSSWPELAYIVPEIGGRIRLPGRETQLQVFRAATAVLQAIAMVRPLVLVLDDLHWADTTSLELLLYLGRRLDSTRALILGTYRDAEVHRQHPLERTLRALIRERQVEEVQLRRLPVTGTRELVEGRLRDVVVSDELVTVVHERAQGNPFFTEELIAAFLEQGAMSDVDKGAQLAAFAHLRVPRGVRAVVEERVARLPLSAQDVLRLASVIGQEFDTDVLLAACGQPQADFDASLDAALDARLIEESRNGYGGRFAFVHALVQQALYEGLSTHRRRRLHVRVGEVLEELRAEHAVPAELARHFLEGGDRDRASAYAFRAGEEAAARYAHAEAAHHFAVALEVLKEIGDVTRAAEVRCRLAAEWLDLNRLPEARAAYEEALASFQQHGDAAGQAAAHWGLGRLHLGRYDMRMAATHLDAAVQLWPRENPGAPLVLLLVDAARATVYSGNSASAMRLSDRALELAEQLADSGLIARALVGVCETHAEGDMSDRQLIGLLDRAEVLARAANDWRTLTRVFVNRSVSCLNLGELQKARADRRRAVETADRSGETERHRFVLQSIGLDSVAAGTWEEGREAARAGLALDPSAAFNGVAVRAVLAWMEGRHEDALDEFRVFWTEARERRDVQAQVWGLALLAESLLQLDRPAEAEAPAREAAELVRSRWPSTIGFVAPLAETLVLLDAPDAEVVLADAERLVEEMDKPAAWPQLLRARGQLLMRRKDLAGAIDALERSAAIARAQHARVQLGRTLFVLGRAARAHGDEPLAAHADAERAELVNQIGPEVRGLCWTAGLPVSQQHARRSRAGRSSGLTPREQQVAALVADGLTDRQIAERLVITEGTAGVHVANILNKLGVHTRAEIARWSMGQLLVQLERKRSAVDDCARAAPELATTESGPRLSPREQQVAGLVAEGLTNRQIAERMIVTERTVAAHVEHIMAKLGVSSRTQIGVWAAGRGAVPAL